uniref:Expressed conserved protein n=1 Tax=Echinococcus granulosus TaxID=6210 RepID=A0A068WW79_ECHGR|nr:hypothetical protein EgrG_001191000 [Echinococcus granulosus]
MRKLRGEDKKKDASKGNKGEAKAHRSLKEVLSTKLHKKKKNDAVKFAPFRKTEDTSSTSVAPMATESYNVTPKENHFYANPIPPPVEQSAEVCASLESNDGSPSSEPEKIGATDTELHPVSEASSGAKNAMEPNLFSSIIHLEGAPTTNTESDDEHRGCSPVTYEHPRERVNIEVNVKDPIGPSGCSGRASTTDKGDCDRSRDSSPEISQTAQAKSSTAVDTAPMNELPSQMPIPPLLTSTAHTKSTTPTNNENHEVNIEASASSRDDSSNEPLPIRERIKIFDKASSASPPQSTVKDVKAPTTGSVRLSHQLGVEKQSVQEKSSKLHKSSSPGATSSSSKRSSNHIKSVNKTHNDYNDDDDSDNDYNDDDGDDSSSDSDSTVSECADEENDLGGMTRF